MEYKCQICTFTPFSVRYEKKNCVATMVEVLFWGCVPSLERTFFLFLSQNLIRINKGVIIFDTFICFVVDNPTMLERLERDVRQD